MNKPLTQIESKFVADWLRSQDIAVNHSLQFHRLTADKIAAWAKKQGKTITPQEVEQAARRDNGKEPK